MPTLIGPGDIIIGSWANFRKNVRVYVDFLAWFVLLAVAHWAMRVGVIALIDDKVLRTATLGILTLPITLVVMALTASLIDATARGLQQKPIDVRESLSTGLHKLIPFIWVSALTTLVVMLGFLALLIPGVIFLIWFRFSQYFTVVDDVRGTAALGASRKLVSGRWFAVFVRLFLPALFYGVAYSFVAGVAFLLAGSVMGDPGLFFGSTAADPDALSLSQSLVVRVLPQILSGIMLPLYVGADLLLWLDLKKSARPSA